MASFTTRVELHRADNDDYETLHDAMKDEGFSRQIQGSDGVWHHLPTAEYNISGTLDSSDVLGRAKRAAKQTGKSSSILVTESAGRTWSNLPEA